MTPKTVNSVTTTYHLEGGLVTYETDGIDQIYYTYDGDDQLASMNLNGEEYFYIRNIQGDIIGLVDETGAEVVSYTYDTWGKVISISGSLASTVGEKNPYLYRGYRFDSETGLYYLQARYYNPEWGRFLNADNFGGDTGSLLSHNVFAYCMNNPVNLSDPSGHFIQFLIPVAILVVRVVMVAVTIYSAYTACKNIYNAYQEGGASAALRQSGTEALDFTGKKFTAPLKLAKKSEKLLKDITSVGAKPKKNTKTPWDIKTGASDKINYRINGQNVSAYQDPKTGLYWAKDTEGHGGSAFKVFELRKGGKELYWIADADEFGNYIKNKHKGDTGLVIKVK